MKEFRLPKAFAEKWLTDLRSGKYKQTTGVLYNPSVDGFCCLGLACITAGYTTEDLKSEKSYATTITVEGDDLPYNLLKHLPNVPDELKGSASANRLVSTLTGKNDEGASFKEIADLIEKNVEFYE